jgi:hypothetical protein
MPVIPALGRLRQEHCKFEASLDYLARPYFKKKKKKKNHPICPPAIKRNPNTHYKPEEP